MKAFVVIATKGRAKETYVALDYLAKQTYPIEKIFVIGSEASDIQGLEAHPLAVSGQAIIDISPTAGSCIQRNVGLDMIRPYVENIDRKHWFVMFFDDDFRMRENWVAQCNKMYETEINAIGVSGKVLADGVHTRFGYNEDAVKEILMSNHSQSPIEENPVEIDWLYGCNMSVRGTFALNERFDENLPLYGWQEDVDYAARALKFGKIFSAPACEGVHMGVSNGRTSGVRFGYSQFANPIYLYKKQTMSFKKALTLMSKNFTSNFVRTLTFNQKKDYRGRLFGNYLSVKDLLTGQCKPSNVIKINVK